MAANYRHKIQNMPQPVVPKTKRSEIVKRS